MLDVAQGRPNPVGRRLDIDRGVEMCHRSISSDRGVTQRRLDPGEMVVTVPHRMIFQKNWQLKWSVTVERHSGGAVELFVGKGADCRGAAAPLAFNSASAASRWRYRSLWHGRG